MALSEPAAPPLTCPSCDRPLAPRGDDLTCRDCSETVPVVDGVARFPVSVDGSSVPRLFDRLSSVYETPLWFPTLYRFAGGPRAPLDDRRLVRDLLDPAGETVLDVACGTGRFTRYVADRARATWGIDLSVEMLADARQSADRNGRDSVAFARMSAADLRFDDGAFDSVACCWAVHLFPDPAATLTEMHRVLRPGGCIAGTTLVSSAVLASPAMQEGVQETIGGSVFDTDEFRSLLVDTGFADVEFDRRGAVLFFGARASPTGHSR